MQSAEAQKTLRPGVPRLSRVLHETRQGQRTSRLFPVGTRMGRPALGQWEDVVQVTVSDYSAAALWGIRAKRPPWRSVRICFEAISCGSPIRAPACRPVPCHVFGVLYLSGAWLWFSLVLPDLLVGCRRLRQLSRPQSPLPVFGIICPTSAPGPFRVHRPALLPHATSSLDVPEHRD